MTMTTLHYEDTQAEIHKVVVGPMDNNVYVLRCTATGDAVLLDAANEHARLFPNVPFNAEQLRREAQSQGKTLLPYWEEKFKVRDAREQAAQKQRDAEIAKWKAEGAKEKETELVSRFGNPETRPMVPSKSPFAVRPDDKLRADNQPWNKSETQLANDRVVRGVQKLAERQSEGFKN